MTSTRGPTVNQAVCGHWSTGALC